VAAHFFRNLIPANIYPIFLLRIYFVFFKRLDDESIIGLPEGFSASVVPAIKDYQELIAAGYDFSNYPKGENIELALISGACLICVFKDKMLAHSTWIAFDHSQAIYDSIFLTGRVGHSGDAFIGPCNTYVPFLGQGLYPAALAIACNRIRMQGMFRALINTKEANQSSMRGIVKSGFEIFGKVRIIYLLGCKLKYFSSLDRSIG
jgi:hypothetical protein